jgi:3'-phosphoadenosine 5'-phosphosulfate sulfotransferase (PAPS reductase)/FAD synthetase
MSETLWAEPADEQPLVAAEASLDEVYREAHDIVTQAHEEHSPSHTFILFSGGNDSTVVAHALRDRADALVHIDTGTALPGVRAHVEAVAEMLGMKLLVYEARDAYAKMVLGRDDFWSAFHEHNAQLAADGLPPISHEQFTLLERQKPGKGVAPGHPLGFPGPGGHRFPYQRLKERQVDALVRDHKTHTRDRILLLSGVRHSESQRRMGTFGVERVGAKVWCPPIVRWTPEHMREYRQRHDLPQSDVAALIHRSGECNCGAFAAPGEREMLAAFYPEWEREVAELEAEAQRRGIRGCKWGQRPTERVAEAAPGPMCTDCQLFDA